MNQIVTMLMLLYMLCTVQGMEYEPEEWKEVEYKIYEPDTDKWEFKIIDLYKNDPNQNKHDRVFVTNTHQYMDIIMTVTQVNGVTMNMEQFLLAVDDLQTGKQSHILLMLQYVPFYTYNIEMEADNNAINYASISNDNQYIDVNRHQSIALFQDPRQSIVFNYRPSKTAEKIQRMLHSIKDECKAFWSMITKPHRDMIKICLPGTGYGSKENKNIQRPITKK